MKKLNFGAMAAMALSLLGISAFTKDEKGKVVLSDEDKEKIKANYGEKYLTTLLDIENSGIEASSEDTEKLYGAMKEHIIAEEKTRLESEKNDLQTKLDAAVADKTTLATEKEKLQADLQTANNKILLLSGMSEDPPKPQGQQAGFFGKKVKYEKGDTIMKVNMSAEHYSAIQQAAERGFPVLASGSTIDVEDVRREFGSYLGQNGQQIRIDIYNQILNGFTSAPEMTTELAEEEYRATQALITSVMQQFKPRWTPLGGFKFKPITIKNRRHKINVSIVPAEILDSYVAFLYEQGLAPDQMPIVKYLIDEKIIPALLDDLEMRASFKGKFVEVEYDENGKVTAGGTPETSMDGIETILVANKNNAESGINYYENTFSLENLKALDPQGLLGYVNDFAQWISNAYKVEKIYCSHDVYTMYKNAYKVFWAGSSGNENPYFGKDLIDFTNKVLKPLDGMYNSPILFATVKQNWKKLKWKKELPFVINDIQKHDYEVRIFGEFSFATGFAIGDFVFAAVPDGYDPSETIVNKLGAATNFKTGVAVKQAAVLNLDTAEGTDAQEVEAGTAIEPIGYVFKGNKVSVAGLPAGVVATIVGNSVIISGTPTVEGAANFTVTVTGVAGGMQATAIGTITVTEQGM